MNYKLVAIDLDGTLLTEEKVIPFKNVETLRLLLNKGIEIVIATGRRYFSAKKFLKEAGIDLTIIANNGAILRNMNDDRAVLKKYFDREDFYRLIKEGRKRNLHPIIHVDHYHEEFDIMIELDKDDKNYSLYLHDIDNRYRKIEDLLLYENPRVLSVVFPGDYNVLKEFYDLLNTVYKDKFNPYILTSLKKIGPILEIMGPMGSKWQTLLGYASERGIKQEEIIAIGDDDNDIEMIKNAGLGVAMKNASPKVLDAADVITEKTNDECGVADILTKIFKL